MGRVGPIFVLSTLIAFGCLIPLWKNPGAKSDKFFWTIVLFVPIMGPILFFGSFHRSPFAQPPTGAPPEAPPLPPAKPEDKPILSPQSYSAHFNSINQLDSL